MRTKVYDLYRALGGEMSTELLRDRKAIWKQMRTALASTPTRKALRVAAHPIDFIREVLSVPESIGRLAEFEAALKKLGWKQGRPLTPRQAIIAADAAAEVTLPFDRGGG